jgi:TPP-dependent pyruvate/acetoin dehydrogenase alpha subunit
MRRMLRARRFDEQLLEHAGLITGVFHVGIGLEGTAAALAAVRLADDRITLTHRNHHYLAALDSDLAAMFAEVLGRDGGPQHGRAGTLHLADPSLGVPHTSAMVGGGVPIALGLALACSRRGEKSVAFACLGDGAMGEGIVHECFNLARLWSLPVVFICESNSQRAGDHANAFQATSSLCDLAAAHQIKTATADGRDPLAVETELLALSEHTRGGGGPTFLEAQSEPWPGNATFLPQLADGALDLASEPADRWSQDDPIRREARRLASEGIELGELLAIDQAVREEVAGALALAIAAAPAEPAMAFASVWGDRA